MKFVNGVVKSFVSALLPALTGHCLSVVLGSGICVDVAILVLTTVT